MEQFSDKRIDPHPIRLLTIYRSSKKEDGFKQNPPLVCLSVQVILFHKLSSFFFQILVVPQLEL